MRLGNKSAISFVIVLVILAAICIVWTASDPCVIDYPITVVKYEIYPDRILRYKLWLQGHRSDSKKDCIVCTMVSQEDFNYYMDQDRKSCDGDCVNESE